MTRTTIIAEAGVNHNGDIETARNLIEVAAEAGADYVKFQTFTAQELVTQEARQAAYQAKNTGKSEAQFEMLRRLELKREDHDKLLQHCRRCGIKFLSTAFDVNSLAFLIDLGISLIKIPSGEITNYPYLAAAASYRKPIILSTGMSTLGDVESALAVLRRFGAELERITILHCTTEYPAPLHEVNLRVLTTLERAFGLRVGYSDHTMGIAVPVAAVALGAAVIEKHFTLDRSMPGPDHPASLEPHELKMMVTSIRQVEEAMGDGIKRVTESEEKNIAIARKSLIASRPIKKGEAFTPENLGVKRPGHGISPMRFEEALGKVAPKDFHTDQIIEF